MVLPESAGAAPLKGAPDHWVAVVKPGRVVFELSYPDESTARSAMNRAIQKLPVKARIITREHGFDG